MALPKSDTSVPGWIIALIILVNLALLVPPMLVAKSRYAISRATRIHIFYDMDQQEKFKAQSANPLFADGRAMRLPVEGTIARGDLELDSHYRWGTVEGEWATEFPDRVQVNAALLDRGQERFGIYCTPCHGISGHGDGMVSRRSSFAEYGAWVITDLSSEKGLAHPIGEIFNITGYGLNTMPGYLSQISRDDRWAIVAFVKALQMSQSVDIAEIPAPDRERLLREKALSGDKEQGALPAQETGSDARQGR